LRRTPHCSAASWEYIRQSRVRRGQAEAEADLGAKGNHIAVIQRHSGSGLPVVHRGPVAASQVLDPVSSILKEDPGVATGDLSIPNDQVRWRNAANHERCISKLDALTGIRASLNYQDCGYGGVGHFLPVSW
jgi:hypothetical protein